MQKDFNQAAAIGQWEQTNFDKLRGQYAGQILQVSGFKPSVQIDASPFLSAQIASVDGKVSIFLANFGGLKSKEIARQIPAQHVKISFSADRPRSIAILPFLGQLGRVDGTFKDGKLSCELPAIQKGVAVWME